MTKEQEEKYLKIVATGRYNEDQLRRIRAGFERPAKHVDIAKSNLHMESVAIAQSIAAASNGEIEADWMPEGTDGSPNALVFLDAKQLTIIEGENMERFKKLLNNADNMVFVKTPDNKIRFTFGFMGIISDGDNYSAN